MGKVNDCLTALAVRRMNTGVYNDMSVEQKEIYLEKLKRDIDEELQMKALQECLMTRYRAHFNKLLDEGEADDILPIVKEYNIEQDKKDDKYKSDYAFITINPHPQASLTEFKQALDKSVKKSFIKKSLHVIEQRGENIEEVGRGFHAHILINKGDYRFSHLRREFASTFKKLCDTSCSGAFNIKLCKKEDLGNRQSYMLDMKADPAKHLKQQFDKVFRKNNLFKDYYGELFDKEIKEVKDSREISNQSAAGS